MAENKFIYSKVSKGESPLVNRYVTREEFFEHTGDKENPHEVTKAQVGLEDVINKPMDSEVTENSENYISSGAVKTYVDANGGSINSISVNNINQPIINKNVNLNVFPIDINEQFIRITDLESGIYRLKFNGTIYIYYNGYSSTDSYIIGDTQTLQIIQPVLTVIKGYNHDKDCDYWYWYLQANEFVKGFIDGNADDGSCGVAFQEPLVSGENIKTINGNSLLGNGNIQTEAYHTFPNTWHTGYGYSTQEFCESVEEDTSAVAGTAYLGTLGCNDLPAGMGQAEAIVEIISNGANGKCMNLTLTSLTNKPYRWTYSYGRVNSHIRTVGWLEVSGQTVKVGNTTFALDADIDLVAGNNVTITPATSGTGAPKITIAATDTTYSDATTSVSGLMSAEDKTKLNGIESGAQVNAANTVIDANYHHISISSSDGVSDGTNTYKYVLPNDVVQDSNYAHITVNSSSVSDGTTTISNIVSDASYVHTDNNFSDTYKGYVDANNAKVSNVQSDWEANSGLAQILNKPSVYTQSEINDFLVLEISLADIDPSHTVGGRPVIIPETAAKIKSFKYRLKFQKVLIDEHASEDDYMILSPSDITNEYDDSIDPATGEPYGTWTAAYYSYISGVGAVFTPGNFITVLFIETPDDLCIGGFTNNMIPATIMSSNGNLSLGDGDGGTIGGGVSYQEPLISGSNIKTINNQNILTSGNIDIPEISFIADINTFTGAVNINGKNLSAYEVNSYSSGDYTGYEITQNNESLNETQAAQFLKGLTGNPILPMYNYDYPNNSYLIRATDGQILKPQYDSNGLKLYNMQKIVTNKTGMPYLTTAPTSDNSSGGLQFVVLSSEPQTKYNGYIYFIISNSN